MITYDYTRIIAWNFEDCTLQTTDSGLVEWVSAEVKKQFPKCEFLTSKLPTGEKYQISIRRLDNRDLEVGWWILDMMCQRGWEPFGGQYGLSQGSSTKTKALYIDLRIANDR